MRTSLPARDLDGYVQRLLAHYLPDGAASDRPLGGHIATALSRIEHSFSSIHRKYYEDGTGTTFDHLHGDHMAAFLYFLANSIWRETGDAALAARLCYVNKIMHGLDLFHSVEMPDIFLLVHPVGTVLGRATYSDYLVVYQQVTVGADTTVYPRFGEGVILYSRSSVLGDCVVGRDVVFAANAMLVDSAVPDHTVVTGQFPAHRFLANTTPVRARCFDALATGASGGGAA